MPPRPPLTHFLCIPLCTPTSNPQLQTSLTTFRTRILHKPTPENPDGIPEKAIRPIGTLHLTLGVMSLVSVERVKSALGFLDGLDFSEGSLGLGEGVGGNDGLGLSVRLRGLRSMHSPSKTSILYSSPVDPESRLLSFCEKVKDVFAAGDFLVSDDRPLLLHATVLNTIYAPQARRKGEESHGKSRARLTIDATRILEEFEEFEWMCDVVRSVAICRMGAKKNEAGEEAYVIEGEVEVPHSKE